MPSPDDFEQPFEEILSRLEHVKRKGATAVARCPAHDDRNPSLSLTDRPGDRVLLNCHAGCSAESIMAALELPMSSLFYPQPGRGRPLDEPEAVYDYHDENGRLLYQVVRYPGKKFLQRRPDGAGGWLWKLGDTRRVLWKLPQLREAITSGSATVYVAEGEKDAFALRVEGLPATTSPQGAGKWRDEYAEQLAGATLAIVYADDDEPGIAHARTVAASLRRHGIPAELRLPAAGYNDVGEQLKAEIPLEQYRPLADAELEPTPEQPGRFQFVSASAFLEEQEPAPEPLLGTADVGLLVSGSLMLTIGEGGASKTTLLLDLAAHLATGRDWLGYHVGEPSPVVLVVNEGPRQQLRDKLRQKADQWAGASFLDNLTVFRSPWTRFGLEAPEQRTYMRDFCRDRGAKLAIVDTLDSVYSLGGGTPSDTKRFVEVMRADAGLNEELAYCFTHFFSKSLGGTLLRRISGAWDRHADTIAFVFADRKKRQTKIVWDKVRWSDGSHKPVTVLGWRAGFSYEVIATENERVEMAEYVNRIAAYLRQVGTSSKRELFRGVKGGRDRLTDALDYGIKIGYFAILPDHKITMVKDPADDQDEADEWAERLADA